ncbi:MAG: hypothetical protein AB7N54_13105 [Alphaproteobacteria bacterium]
MTDTDQPGAGAGTHDESAIATPAAAAAPPPAAGWRDAIADAETRRHAERFATPADAVRAALDLRRQVSTAVQVPGEDAGAEEVAAFRRRLGVPDAPAGYDVALPEALASDAGAQAGLDAFLGAMHAAGATPGAVRAAVDSYAAMHEAHVAALDRARETAEGELRRRWGADFERNREFARRAVRRFAGGEAEALFTTPLAGGGTLGDHPGLVALFASVGRATGEDALHGAGAGAAQDEPKAAIDRLVREAMDAGTYYTAPVQERLQRLYADAYGTAPVVGAGSRRV